MHRESQCFAAIQTGVMKLEKKNKEKNKRGKDAEGKGGEPHCGLRGRVMRRGWGGGRMPERGMLRVGHGGTVPRFGGEIMDVPF